MLLSLPLPCYCRIVKSLFLLYIVLVLIVCVSFFLRFPLLLLQRIQTIKINFNGLGVMCVEVYCWCRCSLLRAFSVWMYVCVSTELEDIQTALKFSTFVSFRQRVHQNESESPCNGYRYATQC